MLSIPCTAGRIFCQWPVKKYIYYKYRQLIYLQVHKGSSSMFESVGVKLIDARQLKTSHS